MKNNYHLASIRKTVDVEACWTSETEDIDYELTFRRIAHPSLACHEGNLQLLLELQDLVQVEIDKIRAGMG